MIPLKSNTEGILFNGSNEIFFECDEIRAEIGDDLPLNEAIIKLEQEKQLYYLSKDLNIKKCEIYYENKDLYSIHRSGGQGKSSGYEMIQSKMKELLKNNNTLFVSNWIEYGPFCIFLYLNWIIKSMNNIWNIQTQMRIQIVNINIF